MKRLVFTAIFACISVFCSATEEPDTLTIIDSSTTECIGFATIYVQKRPASSTIANLNGKFRLKDVNRGDSIIISSIGYKTIHTVYDRRVYHLTPANFILREVIITNDRFRKSLKEIWRQISINAPQPYPVLNGIYRQQIAVNNKLAVVAECDMKMKEPTFKKSLTENAQIRIGDDRIYIYPELDFAKKFTFAMIPAGYPGIGEINPRWYKKFTYDFGKSYKDEQGHTITQILFTKRDSTSTGYIYVDETNNAVVCFHFRRKIKDNDGVGTNLSMKDIYYTWNTTYQRFKNRYVHAYSRLDFEYNIYDKKTALAKYKINAVIDYKTNEILKNTSDMGHFTRYIDSKVSPFVNPDKIKTIDKNLLKGIVTEYK